MRVECGVVSPARHPHPHRLHGLLTGTERAGAVTVGSSEADTAQWHLPLLGDRRHGPSMPSDWEPRDQVVSHFAIPLDDLEAGVHVRQEDLVTEQDTEVPTLPSEAERAAEMRVFTHGG